MTNNDRELEIKYEETKKEVTFKKREKGIFLDHGNTIFEGARLESEYTPKEYNISSTEEIRITYHSTKEISFV